MLARFIARALIAALGLWLASAIVPGVSITGLTTLILAALILGVVNALVRPVVFVLTLPLTILTLGLFLLVVNAAMIGLTAMLLHGFRVDGLVPGLMAAVVTGAVSLVGHAFLREQRR